VKAASAEDQSRRKLEHPIPLHFDLVPDASKELYIDDPMARLNSSGGGHCNTNKFESTRAASLAATVTFAQIHESTDAFDELRKDSG
jgi:hypothetical protein